MGNAEPEPQSKCGLNYKSKFSFKTFFLFNFHNLTCGHLFCLFKVRNVILFLSLEN